jgi:hypothetical protein
VPGGGYLFPAYDLNHAYEDTDVFVSMAKLKNHATCGVTLSMKNCFGMLPASIYGDDAGVDEPNENPTSGRAKTMHAGRRQPSKSAPRRVEPGFQPRAGISRAAYCRGPGEVATDRLCRLSMALNRSRAAKAHGSRASTGCSRECCWRG